MTCDPQGGLVKTDVIDCSYMYDSKHEISASQISFLACIYDRHGHF
jgi:hypothetical protein